MTKEEIDLSTWARKGHYEFFRNFEEPFFGITASAECTRTYKLSRNSDHSFFLHYLHIILSAVNKLDAFCYRIENDRVYRHHRIDASSTIDRADGTFGFSRIPFDPDFESFARNAEQIIRDVRQSEGLQPADDAENVIHFSAIPWVNFTAISHARPFSRPDSSPKIAVGKMTEHNGRYSFPVAVHLHHALADGRDAGRFFELLEQTM